MKISNKTRHLAIYLFSILALITWVVMQTPGLSPTAAYSSKQPIGSASTPSVLRAAQGKLPGGGALTKEQMSARLNELDGIISSLKSQLANNPKNNALLSQLNSAINEYESLSAFMGGDQASPSAGRASASQPEIERPIGGVVVPPGCASATATFTQSTPTAIPAGPAVVTSTVVVSGANTFLFDVNLTTNLTHTFAADLDITIQSPAGTVVTLTTDNGAGNDNVFNGTLWDDDANPAGQVPYSTNNGLATDNAYVNLTTATPLVPEEAMSAFNGEDPNGTWTITISDDLAGDSGSLDSWSLEITSLSSTVTFLSTPFTQSTPTAIPAGPAVVTSTVVVSGANTFLFDVNLTTNLTHTFAADLDITIQSPAGTVVTLTTDNGAGNDNVFNGTLWDDDANPAGQVPYSTNNGLATDNAYVNLTLASPLVPEEAMAAFIGEDPNGTWTITISDDLAGDSGSLDSWTLEVITATCAQPCVLTCPANITVSNDANQCGAVVTYPPPTTTGTCGTITCSPASGSFFPVGTTTVTCTDTGGASCMFTITVNDTQPPVITCPADVTTVTATCGGTTSVVNYTTTASDNCPGVTIACVPPSGSTLPVGTTSVTCTATDAAGNTATCSFTVSVFNACIQDDNNPNTVLLWNTTTGEYRFCCNGTIFTGVGKVSNKDSSHSISHSPTDRRINGVLDCATGRGQGGLQSNAGSLICTINDRNITNNTCNCGAAGPVPVAATK